MPTNMEEVGLAPPAPHPLDHHVSVPSQPITSGGNGSSSTDGPSSQQDSAAPAITTETKDTTTSDTSAAAAAAAAPTEKNSAASTNRCSGCNVSNVPLLACDNNILDQEKQYDQKEGGEDGQQRQRYV